MHELSDLVKQATQLNELLEEIPGTAEHIMSQATSLEHLFTLLDIFRAMPLEAAARFTQMKSTITAVFNDNPQEDRDALTTYLLALHEKIQEVREAVSRILVETLAKLGHVMDKDEADKLLNPNRRF